MLIGWPICELPECGDRPMSSRTETAMTQKQLQRLLGRLQGNTQLQQQQRFSDLLSRPLWLIWSVKLVSAFPSMLSKA